MGASRRRTLVKSFVSHVAILDIMLINALIRRTNELQLKDMLSRRIIGRISVLSCALNAKRRDITEMYVRIISIRRTLASCSVTIARNWGTMHQTALARK
jgi:hypothetical protein